MSLSLIDQLVNAFRFLPGVGPKSAQRLAFHILERNRQNGLLLAETLKAAIEKVGHCKRCHTLTDADELCHICSDVKRDNSLLCIVETPADVLAIEQTRQYKGLYFVLMGHLSPLDGIGPDQIGVNDLLHLLSNNTISEVVLATNPTIEGEATAHYLGTLIQARAIKCSRIAYGVPMGGELTYLDGNTLARSFMGRLIIKS